MPHETMVAIIGRPNVGKSSLFNCLLRERVAIEDPTEGVTRDRLIYPMELHGKKFQMVDTGGIGVVDKQKLEVDVNEQIEFAIGSADFILFLVDGSQALSELDRKVSKKLHQSKVPIILVANKVDNKFIENESSRYLALGFGDAICISVLHQIGIQGLKHKLSEQLPKHEYQEKDNSELRLALSGRRNVGKSSFINLMSGSKRVIVSDMAGTTRDAIDVQVQYRDMNMTLVDTAGLRKKSQTEDSIEFYSVNRTFGALYRADMALLMLDAVEGISQVDQKLGNWMSEHHKPCVIVINKWDLAVEKTDKEEYDKYVRDRLPGLSYAPTVYISVKDEYGIGYLFDQLLKMKSAVVKDLTTPEINAVLQSAQDKKKPERAHGTVPKLFYGTQTHKMPPTFVVFGKCTERISNRYKRYLAQYFRTQLKLLGLPVRFVFKNRTSLYK